MVDHMTRTGDHRTDMKQEYDKKLNHDISSPLLMVIWHEQSQALLARLEEAQAWQA